MPAIGRPAREHRRTRTTVPSSATDRLIPHPPTSLVGRQGLEPWTLGLKGRRNRSRARRRARGTRKSCPIEADRAAIPRSLLAPARSASLRELLSAKRARARFRHHEQWFARSWSAIPESVGRGWPFPTSARRRRRAHPRQGRDRRGLREVRIDPPQRAEVDNGGWSSRRQHRNRLRIDPEGERPRKPRRAEHKPPRIPPRGHRVPTLVEFSPCRAGNA